MLVKESDGDHRPVAAATGDSSAGTRTRATCSFLPVNGHDLAVFTPAVQRAQPNTDSRFITEDSHFARGSDGSCLFIDTADSRSARWKIRHKKPVCQEQNSDQ